MAILILMSPPLTQMSLASSIDTRLPDTIRPYLVDPKPPVFPDRTADYQDTVVKPCEASGGHISDYVCVYPPPPDPAPTIVYTPPPQPTDGYKAFIYRMESGNNPFAINPYSGACGLGQALPCSKMPCLLSDYACQDAYFTNYALSRYGSWERAYYFWIANRWW